jgi:hypothetical protein
MTKKVNATSSTSNSQDGAASADIATSRQELAKSLEKCSKIESEDENVILAKFFLEAPVPESVSQDDLTRLKFQIKHHYVSPLSVGSRLQTHLSTGQKTVRQAEVSQDHRSDLLFALASVGTVAQKIADNASGKTATKSVETPSAGEPAPGTSEPPPRPKPKPRQKKKKGKLS